MSQTVSTPIRPPALSPPLLPLGRAVTACAEVAAVTEVDADAEDYGGGERVARRARKGCSETLLSLTTFFGPNSGSRASCTASDCAISAKLCPRNVWSDETASSALHARACVRGL